VPFGFIDNPPWVFVTSCMPSQGRSLFCPEGMGDVFVRWHNDFRCGWSRDEAHNPIGHWLMEKERPVLLFAAICALQILVYLFRVDLYAGSLQEYLHEPYETFTELPFSENGTQRGCTTFWLSPDMDSPDAANDGCEWPALWRSLCLVENARVTALLKQQELVLSPARQIFSLLRIQNISHKSSADEDLNRRLLS
jgi:hypothetical protein